MFSQIFLTDEAWETKVTPIMFFFLVVHYINSSICFEITPFTVEHIFLRRVLSLRRIMESPIHSVIHNNICYLILNFVLTVTKINNVLRFIVYIRGCSDMMSSILGVVWTPPSPLVIKNHHLSYPPPPSTCRHHHINFRLYTIISNLYSRKVKLTYIID